MLDIERIKITHTRIHRIDRDAQNLWYTAYIYIVLYILWHYCSFLSFVLFLFYFLLQHFRFFRIFWLACLYRYFYFFCRDCIYSLVNMKFIVNQMVCHSPSTWKSIGVQEGSQGMCYMIEGLIECTIIKATDKMQ